MIEPVAKKTDPKMDSEESDLEEEGDDGNEDEVAYTIHA